MLHNFSFLTISISIPDDRFHSVCLYARSLYLILLSAIAFLCVLYRNLNILNKQLCLECNSSPLSHMHLNVHWNFIKFQKKKNKFRHQLFSISMHIYHPHELLIGWLFECWRARITVQNLHAAICIILFTLSLSELTFFSLIFKFIFVLISAKNALFYN